MDWSGNVKVLDNLRAKYGELSASEKKIADFIMRDPEGAVNCNVSELANASGTSDATIIRFCKHAGYSGYYELRITLSRELGRIDQAHKTDNGGDSVSAVLQKYASDILSLARNLDDNMIQKCARILEDCSFVHIVAAGNTTSLANYMGFRLGRLGIRTTYHTLQEYILNDISMAGEKDIVFAISQSGTSKTVVKAMELAKSRKLQTMAVVGYRNSPVSRLADYLLPAIVTEQYFDYIKNYAHLYEMAVIDVLLEQIAKDRKRQKVNLDIPEMLVSDSKL